MLTAMFRLAILAGSEGLLRPRVLDLVRAGLVLHAGDVRDGVILERLA